MTTAGATLAEHFADLEDPRVEHSYARTVNKGHGRIETRHWWVISGEENLQFLRDFGQWKQLSSMVKISSERQLDGKTTSRTRYYITSLVVEMSGTS